MAQSSLCAGRRIHKSECGRKNRPAPFDGVVGWRIELGGFLEFEFGGVAEGVENAKEKIRGDVLATTRGSKAGPSPALQKSFVSNFFGCCFGSWFSVGAGEGFFHHFGDAAVAGFGGAVIEDA